MSKFLISAAVAGALILGSSSALAKAPKTVAETIESDDGYGYKFNDDIVDSGVMGDNSMVIKLRQGIVRRTLIRPRTHFVPELLKSVEQI